MKHRSLTAAVCLLVAGMQLTACQPHHATHIADHPVYGGGHRGVASQSRDDDRESHCPDRPKNRFGS